MFDDYEEKLVWIFFYTFEIFFMHILNKERVSLVSYGKISFKEVFYVENYAYIFKRGFQIGSVQLFSGFRARWVRTPEAGHIVCRARRSAKVAQSVARFLLG